MIEIIVFDLGGVIVNVNFNSPLGKLFDDSGAVRDSFSNKSDLLGLLRQYETGKINALDFHERISDHLETELSFDEFTSASIGAIKAGDDGINGIIETLSKQYQLAILSNTNSVHYEHIKENYSIIGLFEHILLSYEMGTMKPDVEAYEKLIQATSTPASQHLFIDDRIENIIAAKETGMDGIQYKSVKGLTAALRQKGINI